MEIWKEITGYEGLYQVSNTGKVRSLNWRKQRTAPRFLGSRFHAERSRPFPTNIISHDTDLINQCHILHNN